MKKIAILFTVLTLVINSVSGQTIFDWDTNAVDTGTSITEELGGLTTTVTSDTAGSSWLLTPFGSFGGSSGDVIFNSAASVTTVTFTFSQPVVVNSILAIEGNAGDTVDFTFTPDGGDNLEVEATLAGGFKDVDLNWTNVTSFTVTKTGGGFAFDNLSVYPIDPPTIFDWDTNAVDTGTSITEEIGGLTTTVTTDTAGSSWLLTPFGSFGGSSGDVIFNSAASVTTVTFTFSQPVVVNSILAIEGNAGGTVDFTFTPDGGDNLEVEATLAGGFKDVDLNWIDVTSFTVTKTGGGFAFDNLSVYPISTLSVTDNYRFQKAVVYPNPVENILYIKNISGLKSIDVYNNLGQKVFQSNTESIDVGHLSKGMYFLQIHTDQGTETKRVIKK
ncbi:T9SS type A sorting domain-containing protein [Flavivirga amylovorans]|uniref:T9SS type A sorting domain-containing protein n=1 Tax=Flavivirga amylovorans TaxID=870486 RepID=A0ABT8X6K8_9FLAO|nr:T9SS type A sorting domain-containing protein [Flavivirga amylovorans]MDO5989534.1 T9SS type A sorting domain-containing protein [Flavivirga amylovorans]